ncbi:MAG TPA: tripartite tricarboxylate transporter substrate binding protein [Burkholderiales bacterium]|nr:tripartite tricarboxylate transporter substrate binding protein [Burkholderiales bacterium]
MKKYLSLYAIAAGIACVTSSAANAQQWPTRPVRIIVPFPPGQAADIITRIVAERLSPALGQQVIVDNRPGAGAALGTEIGAKSPPDGYTQVAGGSAALAINPHLYRKLGYDTPRDFAPVIQLVSIPMVFVVNPSLAAQNLKELIQLAKRNPGELNYGSSGSGSTSHLVTAALASRAGITLTHVPYKGAVQSLTDLIAGQVMLVADTPPTVVPHIQSKRIRAIATSMLKRIPQLPEVPTVDEQGLKGYDLNTWTSLVAPTGTPIVILDRLNNEVAKIIAQPEVQKRLIEMGFIPVGNSREQFARFLVAEYANWAKIVQASGAKVE